MSKKKKHEEHENHERWLVSYADFITLLFAFFVVMYSSSKVDGNKMGAVEESIQRAFGPVFPIMDWDSSLRGAGNSIIATGNNSTPVIFEYKNGGVKSGRDNIDIGPHKSTLKDSIDEIKKTLKLKGENLDQIIRVSTNEHGLVISIADRAIFNPGQATIREEIKPFMNKIAEAILKVSSDIRVEGHTDNIPINTSQFPSNWELSTARATSIIRYFLTQYPFDPQKLSAAGYGEFRPLASNDTEEGRAKNRRVDIFVYEANSKMVFSDQPDDLSLEDDLVQAREKRSEIFDMFFPSYK